ncbi:unnamed protein product [Chrysoparadoxa australica]
MEVPDDRKLQVINSGPDAKLRLTKEDQGHCEVCQGDAVDDIVIICDVCVKDYHLRCLSPPLREAPKGEWLCPVCTDGERQEWVKDLRWLYGLEKAADEAIAKKTRMRGQIREKIDYLPSKVLRVLEMCKGTGSLSKYCKRNSGLYEVVSVDMDESTQPDFVSDILTWSYGSLFNPGDFDVVWFSPPCNEFSCVNTTGNRDLDAARKIVLKGLEIIEYFRPPHFFIENPQTGLLKDQPYMQNIPYYDLDYCRYAWFGYRKRTRIWTNLKGFSPLLCQAMCGQLKEGGTEHFASFGGCQKDQKKQKARYRVPYALLHQLLFACRASHNSWGDNQGLLPAHCQRISLEPNESTEAYLERICQWYGCEKEGDGEQPLLLHLFYSGLPSRLQRHLVKDGVGRDLKDLMKRSDAWLKIKSNQAGAGSSSGEMAGKGDAAAAQNTGAQRLEILTEEVSELRHELEGIKARFHGPRVVQRLTDYMFG